MARKRYAVEQIIAKLKDAEVELAKGSNTPEARHQREHILPVLLRVGCDPPVSGSPVDASPGRPQRVACSTRWKV